MEEIENFSLTARDGTILYGREWLCDEPVAMIGIVHGLGEHIGRYEHVAQYFNSHQVAVFGIDLRGHGHSEGKRGHAASFEILLSDVEELLMYARAEYNDLPMFLFGHSLGGNIVSNYILQKNVNELTGSIISSPWLQLATAPPAWQLKLAFFVSRFLPSLTQSNQLEINHLTNDDAVNQAYKNDPLVHDKISTRLFTEAYHAGLWALDHASVNKIPLLVYHGAEDHITSSLASSHFAQAAGTEVTYKRWEGIKHEPHNDIDKEEVLTFVLDWLSNLAKKAVASVPD